MPTDLDAYLKEYAAFLKCDAELSEKLFDDFKRLAASAQHGITETQAKSILGSLAQIQKALESGKTRRENYDRINNRRLNHITLDPE